MGSYEIERLQAAGDKAGFCLKCLDNIQASNLLNGKELYWRVPLTSNGDTYLLIKATIVDELFKHRNSNYDNSNNR